MMERETPADWKQTLVATFEYDAPNPPQWTGSAIAEKVGDHFVVRSPIRIGIADELRRFNDMRREMLQGIPPTNDEPMPLAPTGVGGDVGGPD
jgi:hypothetical protein